MPAQCRVRFTMLVEIRRQRVRAVLNIHEKHHAFTDVDVNADVPAAPRYTSCQHFLSGENHWRLSSTVEASILDALGERNPRFTDN